MPETDTWKFNTGDVVREEHEPHAPGGVPIGRSEYTIEMRLVRESDGKRFYYHADEEGAKHLISASGLERTHEVVE